MFAEFQRVSPLTTENPLVSIAMFCRDRVHCIRRAVESILQQSYANWELVIQDGASTDGTKEAIESYRDRRIKLISAPDRGPFDAMWKAYQRCQGEIVGTCLSDEELLPHTLAEGVKYFLFNQGAGAFYRDVFYTDINGAPFYRHNGQEFNSIDFSNLTLCTFMFRKEAMLNIGLMTRDWRLDCADSELMTRLGERYHIHYFPGGSAKYSQFHQDQLSTNPAIGYSYAVGHLKMINEFYRSNPRSNLLRDIPIHSAYQTMRSHYIANQADEFRDRWETVYQECKLGKTENSFARAAQAAGIGKLILAYQLLLKLEILPENWKEILTLQAEILAQLHLPAEAIEIWECAANAAQQFPHAGERILKAQLDLREITNLKILAKQKKWAQALPRPTLPPFVSRPLSGRFRVALHAADWSKPNIRLQILPLLPHLKGVRVEIHCYASKSSDPSLFPEGVTVHFLNPELSEQDFAEKVRADQIDLFLELSGLDPGHRLAALTVRVAPMQMGYLGHFATTGVRQVDYLLTDQVLCPPGSEKFFTEKLLRLPNCFMAFPGKNPLPLPYVPKRLDDRFTFGSFSPTATVNHRQIELWAQILQKVPKARMLFAHADYSNSDSRSNLRALFAAHDIQDDRLLIVSRSENEISPSLMIQVDLYLDTFPRSDFFGIAHALQLGIPSVTQTGETMASRTGASLLLFAALPDHVTATPEHYLNQAIQLAQEPARLNALRSILVGKLYENGLTNLTHFAQQFQTTLLGILDAGSSISAG